MSAGGCLLTAETERSGPAEGAFPRMDEFDQAFVKGEVSTTGLASTSKDGKADIRSTGLLR